MLYVTETGKFTRHNIFPLLLPLHEVNVKLQFNPSQLGQTEYPIVFIYVKRSKREVQ